MNPTKLLAITEWQMFRNILDKEIRNISEEEWDQALTFFKGALDAGQRYLQYEPNDPDVSGPVGLMQYLLLGLGDIDVYGRALLYCGHGFSALVSCEEQLAALQPGSEIADIKRNVIMETFEEEAIGALQAALQMKPDYTCAQEILQEAQAMFAELQGKPDAIDVAKMMIAMLNPNHPIDQRIRQDLMAVIETGNRDLVQLVMETSRTVDQLLNMEERRQFQEGLSVAARAILVIVGALEQYPQARPYLLFNWGRLHITSAALLYGQWLAAHPKPRGADGKKLEEALAELKAARQLTNYPNVLVEYHQDLTRRIENTLRDIQKKGWLAGRFG